jgi:phage terminase small subunit
MSGVKGQSGRKRKPTREKQLLGDHHTERQVDGEPETVDEHPIRIEDIEDEAKWLWDYLEPMLHNNGTLSATDGLALHRLCTVAAKWLRYHRETMQYGAYVGEGERAKIAPWAQLEQRYGNQLDELIKSFGMTPATRNSVEKVIENEDPRPIQSVT